jgi:hypothetical protein
MSATGLTETQWMILSAASQRDDHCAMLPPSLRGGAARQYKIKSLDEPHLRVAKESQLRRV